MKKLFLLIAMVIGLAMAAKAELTATAVTEMYPEYAPVTAMVVDDEDCAVFQPAVVYVSGHDIEVIILGKKFEIKENFTVPNVIVDRTDTQAYPLEWSWPDYINVRTQDGLNIMLTKNFFVKNNKWCITVNHSFRNAPSYFEVFDEEGNNLGKLSVPGYYSIILDGITSGTPYLLSSDEEAKTFQLYTFTGNAGIEANKVAAFTKAYPNPLPAGATFTVDFNQAADNATFFTVLDMNGRQLYRSKVKPGETSFKLSGARFGHGQYVYTVVYGNGEAISGKLMAE